MSQDAAPFLPLLAIANLLVAAAVVLALARAVVRHPLAERPDALQNAGELALGWFHAQARLVSPRRVALVTSFLATLFFLILCSNLLAVLPVPLLRFPPTAYYSVPLALALAAVIGGFILGARIEGLGASLRHLVWPNPLQLVGEASHALSLSLRLYGNIGGEYIVAILAARAAPWGIPMIIHALGLIPAVVQPMVFTLLTANFLAASVHATPDGPAAADAAGSTPSTPDEPRETRTP